MTYSAAPIASSAMSATKRRNQRLGLGDCGGSTGRPGRPMRCALAARLIGRRSSTAVGRRRALGSGSSSACSVGSPPLLRWWPSWRRERVRAPGRPARSAPARAAAPGRPARPSERARAAAPGGTLLRRPPAVLGGSAGHYRARSRSSARSRRWDGSPSSPFTAVISPMTGTIRPCPCMYVLCTGTDSSTPADELRELLLLLGVVLRGRAETATPPSRTRVPGTPRADRMTD